VSRSLDFIKTRATMPGLKGRIIDLKGGGITVTDGHGRVLAKGFSAKILNTYEDQEDLAHAPVTKARLQITKATPDGSRRTYTITRPMKDVVNNLSDVLLKGVGDDTQFLRDDPYDSLLLVILSASTQGTEEYAPTYYTAQFSENGRWFYASDAEVGKQAVALAASAEVEVVREIKDPETGEVSLRLRVPRADCSGYEYCTASWLEAQSGQFNFPGRAVSVHSAAKLWICMNDRYGALSAAEKLGLAQDELRQHVEEVQKKQVAAWGFREWNLSR
jgi:hypothetical protein